MRSLSFLALILCFCRLFAQELGNGCNFCVVTQDGKCQALELWSQKSVSYNGKTYTPYTAFLDDGSHIENLVFLRQDGKKVFAYDTNTESEHLMFDFGLQKGDMFSDGYSATSFEVKDIRDTIINKNSHQLIELQGLDDESVHNIWIGGVGSLYTGFIPRNNYFRHVYMLISNGVCSKINNQFVKTGDMDVKRLVWEKELKTEEDWEEYFNWFDAPSDLNAEFIGDTLCIRGRLHTSCELQKLVACILNDNHVTFKYYSAADVDCITNYEIDARIPGFQRGKYQIKLLNKTVELENTEGGYTLINNVAPVWQENSLYDMQGRKVNSNSKIQNSKSQKGIYIQNGKKVMR